VLKKIKESYTICKKLQGILLYDYISRFLVIHI